MSKQIQISQRCQSCGTPLKTGDSSDESFFGTNKGGSKNSEYCKFCYFEGEFANKEATAVSMQESFSGHLIRVMKVPEPEAKERARNVVLALSRWKRG